MKSDLKLTVLIPTYNRSVRLNRSLPAYLANKRKDIEFFIVDNCSPDDTEKTVQKWIKKDRRIRYFKQYTNVGANRSLFIGMLLSKAPLVMIMPDDDYMTKGFIDVVIRKFEEYPGIGLVHSSMYDERNRLGQDASAFYEKGPDAILKFYMLGGAIPGLTFRKSKINFDVWKLDNRMYPQVLAGCDIARNNGIYVVEGNKEYVKAGTDDSAIQMATARPRDFGVIERVSIIHAVAHYFTKSTKNRLAILLKLQLFRWAVAVYLEMFALDKNVAKIYLKTLTSNKMICSSMVFWYSVLRYIVFAEKFPTRNKLPVLLSLILLGGKALLQKEGLSEIFFAMRWKASRVMRRRQ